MPPKPDTKTVRLRIHGRVQGVFYRAWTVGEAEARGLSGWVRNRSDGTVEAVVSGRADKVDDLIAACRLGPPRAAVAAIDVLAAMESEAETYGSGFRQGPTD